MAAGAGMAYIAVAAMAAGAAATAYSAHQRKKTSDAMAKKLDAMDPEKERTAAEQRAERRARAIQQQQLEHGKAATYHAPLTSTGMGSAKINKRKLLG